MMMLSVAAAVAVAGSVAVESRPGYNSWPMIQSVGERLVCTYSRGTKHDVFEGVRGAWAKWSDDGGRTWSGPHLVADDPTVGETPIGKGLDSTGAALFWIRAYGEKTKRHELYRTTDGVTFERISVPSLDPMPVQITDIFRVPGRGLVALWFAGNYLESDTHKCWGELVSTDDGRTWTQRTIERDLAKDRWPTEPSVARLPDGRLICIARSERYQPEKALQWQLESTDGGFTWTKRETNIRDVMASTPSLVYDEKTDLLYNYYYERGKCVLKRRVVRPEAVWGKPLAWPEPEVVSRGSDSPWDSGNACATFVGQRHYVAYYTGKHPDTSVVVAAADAVTAPQSELLFMFDTEDFTNPRSWDAAKRLAEIFTEEGVTAQFQVVGSFARQLERHGRTDVIAALAKHDIGTHTLYHSVHPDILELSDGEDYDIAYQRVMAQESECAAELKRIFGKDRLWGSNPPGMSESYVADRVYADLGIRYGVGPHYTDFFDSDIWYAGQRRIPYSFSWENFIAPATKTNAIREVAAVVEHLAKVKRGIVFCHPNKVASLDYWDELNYNGGNFARWGEWTLSKPRPAGETERYLAWIRDILRRLKADVRFRFTTIPELDRSTKPRVAIRRADIPAIRAHFLANGLKPLREPASWCVADVFCAAVAMLRGKDLFLPDNAYGFLSKPEGVTRTRSVSRRDLVAAAKAMDVTRFLPATIAVGGEKIGPADFLFAALETLATGAEAVTVVPREQLGEFKGTPVAALENWDQTWIHAPDFRNAYCRDRLRWQLWTLRWE